jgi:pimeloyl-ACP methyl ester carboxylesterase
MTALANDVARLRQVLEILDSPTIVVGHSYGGQIMTSLGTDAPNVVGLVYIAAFALDEGESLGALLSQGPVTPALEHLFTDKEGFGWLSEEDFVYHFAADVDPVKARVMYAVQQALAGSAFSDVMGTPHGSHFRPGTSSPKTTKPYLQRPRSSSLSAWAPQRSKSPPAMWRWSPIPTPSQALSNKPPRRVSSTDH